MNEIHDYLTQRGWISSKVNGKNAYVHKDRDRADYHISHDASNDKWELLHKSGRLFGKGTGLQKLAAAHVSIWPGPNSIPPHSQHSEEQPLLGHVTDERAREIVSENQQLRFLRSRRNA